MCELLIVDLKLTIDQRSGFTAKANRYSNWQKEQHTNLGKSSPL